MQQYTTEHAETMNPTQGKHHLCPHRGKKFTKSSNLKAQILTHTKGRAHVCAHCDKTFSRPTTLKRHMICHTEERPHKCPDCDKSFSRSTNLNRHILLHTGEKPHKCPHCDKGFTLSTNLKRHILIHIGEKTHKCPDCDKSFSRSTNLDRHILLHTGEKPHKCPHCDKGFSLSTNLKRHILIHTGEKTHKCPHCNKKFTRSENLKGHISIHTGERPYKCLHCNMRFSHLTYLSRHIQTHSRERTEFRQSTHVKIPAKPSDHETQNSHVTGNCNLRKDSSSASEVRRNSKARVTSTYKELPKMPEGCKDQRNARKFVQSVAHGELFVESSINPTTSEMSVDLDEQSNTASGSMTGPDTVGEENLLTCTRCIKGFEHISDLERHIFEHNGDKAHLTSGGGETRRAGLCKCASQKLYVCPFCKTEFLKSSNLNVHIQEDHLRDTRESWCNMCVFGFSKTCDIESHLALHNKVCKSSCVQQ